MRRKFEVRSALVIALLVAREVVGQEALKISLAGERAARARKQQVADTPWSVRWGDLKLKWSGREYVEWNDNINLLPKDEIADVIFRTQLGLDAALPLSARNQLELNLVGGYSKYAEHSEFDRPYLLPGSRFGLDFYLEPFRITLEDLLTYQQDSAERAVVVGTDRYGGIDNLAGVNLLYDGNRLKTSLSYHYRLFRASTAAFNHLDRDSHPISFRSSLKVAPGVDTGVEAGYTTTAYVDSFLNDNHSLSGGGFVAWTPSPLLSMNGRGGVVSFDYDSKGGIASSGTRSTYFEVDLRHQLRRRVALSLEAGRDSSLGVNNNQVDSWYFRPVVDWNWRRISSLSISYQLEDGEEFGQGRSEPFKRTTISCATSWRVAHRWTAGVRYSFARRESDLANRGYDNHRISFDIGF